LYVVKEEQNRPVVGQSAKHPCNRRMDLIRPGGGVTSAGGMLKQDARKGNDRPEDPAQRLADLLHLGPRARQQADFEVLGKCVAEGSV
jgi:hypothetical protein